jgi:hypothetical protein
MAAPNLDWLYHLLGYTLAAAGALLLLWSLFWDRSRGRRRCPKCWYDMRGVPGLRCPECGRSRRHERGLFKTRRHPRWASLAIVICTLGYAATTVPRYRAGGWLGLVPSTYLAFFAPAKSASTPTIGWTAGPAPAAPAARTLTDETWERLERGSLWLWQSQAYLRRVMKFQGTDPDQVMQVPKVWPLAVEIPCAKSTPSLGDLTLSMGPPGAVSGRHGQVPRWWYLPAFHLPASSVEGVVQWTTQSGHVVYRSRKTFPIEARVPVSSFLSRMDSPEVTARVQAMLCPHVAEHENRLELVLFNRPDSEPREPSTLLIVFTCEVRHGQRILATTRYDDTPYKPNARIVWSASRIDWPDDVIDLVRRGQATITIRGDYDGAIRVYTKHPFDPPERACWTGEFTAPLPMKPNPRKQ